MKISRLLLRSRLVLRSAVSAPKPLRCCNFAISSATQQRLIQTHTSTPQQTSSNAKPSQSKLSPIKLKEECIVHCLAGRLSEAEAVVSLMQSAGFFIDPQLWSKLIESYVFAEQAKTALAKLQQMKVSARNGTPYIPKRYLYFIILQLLVKKGFQQDAEALFQEMKNYHPIMNDVRGLMLKLYTSKGKMEEAQTFIKNEWSPEPLDIVAYGMLAGGYVRARKPVEDVLNLLRDMIQIGNPPNMSVYHTILGYLSDSGRISDMNKVIAFMKEEAKVAPCITSYNILIKTHLADNDTESAKKILEQLKTEQLQPDVVTYNTFISALAKANRIAQAEEIMNTMKCEPDEFTYVGLIDGYSRHGHVDKAQALMKIMREKNYHNVSLEKAYNAMINGYCLLGQTREALNMINKMHAEYIRPSAITYSIVIHTLCKLGHISEAEALLEAMVQHRIQPTAHTLAPLMNTYALHGLTDKMKALYSQAQKQGVEDLHRLRKVMETTTQRQQMAATTAATQAAAEPAQKQ